MSYICERCGKEVEIKYGSGRFCSLHCAKSHVGKTPKKKITTNFNKYNSIIQNKKERQFIPIDYLCKCMNGHSFDYRKRERLNSDELKHYAPCQGKCPICGTTEYTFVGVGNNLFPIFNMR